ncbi:MAG: glycosyltransferase family 2 protein [Candidatus Saccharimonadales bacterium]
MLENSILLWIITLIGLVNFVHISMYIGAANLYDIFHLRRKNKARKAPESVKVFNPHVTVLIPAHNERLGIIRCLETVSKSTYKNMSIVVIDDASKDNTSELVREFIAKHSRKATSRLVEKDGKTVREYFRATSDIPAICLLTRPVNSGKAAGLNYALQNAVTGGLTMTLDADSALDAHAIENAVAYFRDEKVVGVAANVKIMQQNSVLGMLQKFEHMIGYRSKKFYSLTNCEFVIGGVASTYRYETLKELGFYDTDTATEDIALSMKITSSGNRERRLVYAADVVASTEGVQTFGALLKQRYRWKLGTLQVLFKYRHILANTDKKYSRTLTMYRMPMAFLSEVLLMLQPFILGYILFLSISNHSLGTLLGGYLTITAYVLWSLWPDEHHTTKDKLLLSLYSPGMYFTFFIMDFIQIVAIFRCMVNFKQFTQLSDKHVTWTSPERVGSAA